LSLLLRGHVKRALKCADSVAGVVGLGHALTRPLERARPRSRDPSLRTRYVARPSTVLRPRPIPSALSWTSVWPYTRTSFRGFRLHRRVREGLPSSSPNLRCMPSPIRRSGSGLLQNPRPGLLPSPISAGLGPLDPLRVHVSTRQSSTSLRPAALFHLPSAPPLDGLPEISLPGSSGGLPGPDSHRLVDSPCWAVPEIRVIGAVGRDQRSAGSRSRLGRRGRRSGARARLPPPPLLVSRSLWLLPPLFPAGVDREPATPAALRLNMAPLLPRIHRRRLDRFSVRVACRLRGLRSYSIPGQLDPGSPLRPAFGSGPRPSGRGRATSRNHLGLQVVGWATAG
jgi:hypothetical protein